MRCVVLGVAAAVLLASSSVRADAGRQDVATAQLSVPGQAERLAAALGSTGALVVDAQRLYFTNGYVEAIPNTPGPHSASILSKWGQGWGKVGPVPWQITADESFVYTTDLSGILTRIPKTGGVYQELGWFDHTHSYRPAHLAVDHDYLYLTSLVGQSVLRLPKSGGAIRTLYQDVERRCPGPLALDAHWLYWVNQVDGSLMRLSKSGGAADQIGKGRGRSFGLAIDSSAAYFTDYDAGRVLKAPLAGGETVVLASGLGQPTGIAVDDRRVYWADGDRGSIVSTAKDGSDLRVLASGQQRPVTVALNGQYVYWLAVATGDGDGAVLRIRKPPR